MGTTIRREPVNFDIPDAPNYKFLNITNFRGLDVSSNPFELATNTASDCLNVYVDETNTLTTRPRLEKKIATPIDGEHIGTYNLHNGYLLHYITANGPEMWFFRNNNLNDTKVSGNVPTHKCNYFEQGDKVYLLDGERYMVISENTLVDVEGFIPTVASIRTNGERVSLSGVNLLTQTYKETYSWDGIKPLEITDPDAITIEDKNYSNRNNLFLSADSPLNSYKIYMIYDDYSFIATGPTTPWLAGEVSYFTSNDRLESVNAPVITGATENIVTCASKSKTFWTKSNNILYNYYLDSDGQWKKSPTTINLSNTTSSYCQSSPNGNYLYVTYKNSSSVRVHYFYKRNVDDNTFSSKQIATSTNVVPDLDTYSLCHDGNVHVLDTEPCRVVFRTHNNVFVGSYETGSFIKLYDTDDTNINSWGWLNATSTGSLLYAYLKTSDKMICIKNFDVDDKFFIEGAPSTYKIADDLSYGFYYKENFEGRYDIFVTDVYINPLTATKMNVTVSDKIIEAFSSARVSHYSKIELKNIIFVQNNYGLNYHGYETDDLYVWNPDGLPHIDVYKKVQQGTTDYTDWQEKRQQFLKSKLITRFDNNYWFSSGNRYYRSSNNDPTYFPITEYNDLGDSNEDITGFNLANDTTLIAYKKNKIFLIQPFTSSLDTTEYTITESKNTVGNTAIGAPIVTTLTEIPLQINNDGIYGLSQLSNVSATERIADLMSEPINEKWLDIPDELIASVQTLNRLYWTYIIIPDTIHEKTMIYLLDNRSNSWYYWELPIVVVNAFTKDNRAEFVDADGNIYYLTSTDVINKAFDTQLITEYYDDGRKLIPWYWQSQIMPLGTMNYSKRLVNTTFILTDTDDKDGYGLNYSFKVFRKLASSTPEKELTGDLTLVRSTTKKTNISKFGFVQLKLSNITEESQGTEPEKAFRNNKLRLVGLGLKYVLLEGLIR